MTGTPDNDYLADGLTENIITGLSGCPKLLVIARNSSFVYKGKAVEIRKMARDLGVRYVVEGGIQKSDDLLRTTVQLIDADTEHHLWAEKYDSQMKDIFALQDDITIKIVTALEIELTEGEQARLRVRGPGNLQAYLKALKARELWRRQNRESNALAKREIEEAIELAPGNSMLHTMLLHRRILWICSWGQNPLSSL
jgi:adenylate cyclase